MLVVKGIDVYYGNFHILKKVTMHINQGEIVSLIGANGAGKTTLLKAITGLARISSGDILFQGQKINNLEPYERVSFGICLVPEGKGLFKSLTVEDNLLLGAYAWYSFRKKKEVKNRLEEIFELFSFLKERRNEVAGRLSGGQQQILAIARALMGNPKLLLLDEPSMGIAPNLVLEIFQHINRFKRDYNLSIILVEQNARLALKISDRAYVLETGKIIYEGDSTSLIQNPEIQRAYLGRELDREVPLNG
ncbi:MAG: ABC transporter ATP-binding protein [Caldimicrobium sp.]